jgi:predicted metal-dependent enzyme (double-stranded beta helix superfamily)
MTATPAPACVQQSLIEPCARLSRRSSLALSDLRGLAEGIDLDATQRDALRMPDPSRPYGRRVLMADPLLEVMVASWTPGVMCAPHDHGGSVGAVKVLQGRARHRVYKVEAGALVLAAEHTVEAGEVLACGPDLIHAMGDDGAADPLMTLHLYTDSIDFMVVYEPAGPQTHVVSGSCGAWVPHDQPAQLLRSLPGMLRRGELAG